MPADPPVPNPWRETVRDLYDALMLGTYGSHATARLLTLIEKRHCDYFGGHHHETDPPVPAAAILAMRPEPPK